MVAQAREKLLEANARMKLQGGKKIKEMTYKQGDRVLLSTKNITTVSDRGTPAALRKPYAGPFTVTQVFRTTEGSPHAYELNLPPAWRCHPVFKGRLLEPYQEGRYLFPGRKQELPPVPVLLDNGREYHEVERILADRTVKVRRGNRTTEEKQWLTRLKGEGAVGDEWLSIENLSDELGECEEWVRYEAAKRNARVLRAESERIQELNAYYNYNTGAAELLALMNAERPHSTAGALPKSLHIRNTARMNAANEACNICMGRYQERKQVAIGRIAAIQSYEEDGRTQATLNLEEGQYLLSETPTNRPSRLRILVLFNGTGSVEKMLHKKYKHSEIISVDSNPRWTPTHCVDIEQWADPHFGANFQQYPVGYFDIIWASPPCEEYSQAKTIGTRNL